MAAASRRAASSRRRSSSPTVVVNDDVRAGRRGAGQARAAGPRASPTTDCASIRIAPMIKPRVDKLLEQTDSHYAAVVVAAKRARQINTYYHSLSEGDFGEYTPPMVETRSGKNYLTISLEEIAAGKIKYEYKSSVSA